jgi:hypothetical protein
LSVAFDPAALAEAIHSEIGRPVILLDDDVRALLDLLRHGREIPRNLGLRHIFDLTSFRSSAAGS